MQCVGGGFSDAMLNSNFGDESKLYRKKTQRNDG